MKLRNYLREEPGLIGPYKKTCT